jgi:hypothetical protein
MEPVRRGEWMRCTNGGTLQEKYDADNRREAEGAPTKTMSPAS